METKKLGDLIKKSLIELAKITNETEQREKEEQEKPKQESKLIFPEYRNGNHKNKKRVSEQEARLLFIRELEKEEDKFYYSIETPTAKLYNFSEDKNAPKIVFKGQSGRSASFDLTIYKVEKDKFKRVHFVEFKNENVDTVKKDFLKLLCDENDKENYLVHIINRVDLNEKDTLKSIIDKYKGAMDYISTEYEIISTLKVILFNINNPTQTIWFEDISKNNTEIREK